VNALPSAQVQDFELDPVSYQLLCKGSPVKLERIPMELLLFLASRPGELVTRAEIIEKLWGKDVFLDTENGINTAIRKVRLALQDDPEEPRFVLTVAGRGYRFIAPIKDQNGKDCSSPKTDASSRKVAQMGPLAGHSPDCVGGRRFCRRTHHAHAETCAANARKRGNWGGHATRVCCHRFRPTTAHLCPLA
jgi:DNA-binding winged helix-turn-helix (wHTH) protein